MRCNRPDCGRLGEIDDQGFCGDCAGRPSTDSGSVSGEPVRRAAGVGARQVRLEPWWGLELARSGRIPPAAIKVEAQLDESQRYCSFCHSPVGRGHDDVPGRSQGFCPVCRTPFDNSRSLSGQLLAGRYEIKGLIAAGGQGTTYLVHDRNLNHDVVLKALRTSVARTALQERDALVGLRHDSIVRILSYEPDGPYLVLEHVPGAHLSASAEDPLDVTLAHGLQILQALDYLHARGLLHCDVKPSNIVRFAEDSAIGPRDRVRLVDFGAVRTTDDPTPASVYTENYAPPDWVEARQAPDPEHTSPTAGFDLFCLGRTLEELCRRHLRDRGTAPGVDSLRRLIARATDTRNPERRFVSARQFAEQLSGVIRQVVADPHLDEPLRVTRASVLFGPMTDPLHGGLGAPRPLDHWITARPTADGGLDIQPPFATPSPVAIAAALPAPLTDPDSTTRRIPAALAECRAALRRGAADNAEWALSRSGLPGWHWLSAWYAGLIALCRESIEPATERFSAVRDMAPGEIVPLLALGLCAELSGDLTVAQLHYRLAATTDPTLGAAGFGLARVNLLAGRRAEAVEAAERLASEFRYEREGQIAALRLRIALHAPHCAPPSAADLTRARELLTDLDLDTSAGTALRAELQYARSVLDGGQLELSETVRQVAESATTEREFVALVDLANRLRPPLRWGWRALRTPGRCKDVILRRRTD